MAKDAELYSAKTVVIEYSYDLKRVIVRGVWDTNKEKYGPAIMKPSGKESTFNQVMVFEGMDMGKHHGFSRLVPEDTECEQKEEKGDAQ